MSFVIRPPPKPHCGVVQPATELPQLTRAELEARVHGWVEEYLDFVWRSLRSLGVPRADCDDGCQKVWWVVARKAETIQPGKERSYIFSVVMRVASEMRRSEARHYVVPLDPELPSSEPGLEELCEQRRARSLLESLLASMPWEQRVVFVMFELEGLSSHEIARSLDVPRGTVASRLRLAREAFNRALSRYQSVRKSSVRLKPVAVHAMDADGATLDELPLEGAYNE